MFDDALKAKVNSEVGRINGELCDLKELEESTRIRRARLEVEMRQAIAMRDMFELFSHLDKQPAPAVVVRHEPVMPEHPNGPQFAIPVVADAIEPEEDNEAAPDRPGKYKPAGLPSVPDMITATLRAAGPGGLQTKQIAEFVRRNGGRRSPVAASPASLGA
jgi:hypothetical protein